ncbi:MAG: cation diffusion facilitator family transporter [Mobilitalea sp.]
MTDYLVKLFIKNSEKIEDQRVRTSYGILSSVVGMICNVILFAVKMSIGIVINSISIMADAFNNLSDAASSIISFVGVKLADKPADKEHPFGHGRFEYISALVVAFLVLQVGFSLLKSSFDKVLNPQGINFNPWLVGILCLSVLVKGWMMLFNRKLGNRINSTLMKATAADSMGDMLVTTATIISTVIAGITGWKIDGYMGLLVSFMVLWAGFKIAKETLEPLLGEAVDKKVYEQISKLVESYPGIEGTHDLIIHNYGPTHRMATIHAEVPSDTDILKSHETIDRIERDARSKLDLFLVIHMDPIEINNVKVVEKKNLIEEIVAELAPKASIHDFRMINGEKQINLIFDLVVPHSYTQEQEHELLINIRDRVKKVDPKCLCVISVENSFVEED